jgi:3-oxoacyl-[acyl-carrier protein] reductase
LPKHSRNAIRETGTYMQLKEKVIAITGAARGIGQAMAIAFAERGARLALIDLSLESLASTAAKCSEVGFQPKSYACDVSKEDAVTTCFNNVGNDFLRLDALVNNAGITRDALLVSAKDGQVTGKMSLQQWQQVMDINLTGVFLCGREAASHMIKGGNGGVIINISSISQAGNAGQSNYAAAKAGVTAMTVTWAKELARYGIRCAAIAPGFIKTDILNDMKPEMLERIMAAAPLKRAGIAAEIAHGAIFILTNEYFTGRVLEIDGGLRL